MPNDRYEIGQALINFFTWVGMSEIGPIARLIDLIQQWQNGDLSDDDFAQKVTHLGLDPESPPR